MRERDLFIECLQRESPAERDDFLAAACAGDETLRRRVDRLLQEHERPDRFILDAPPPGVATAIVAEGPGANIGPYKLLDQIGEGGMGVVFLAEQQSPVRRKVALKIVKPGMDSRQVIARFEAELQALSLMDHPNIARVLDAGTTDAGRPYFVMELVKGVPITRYCDEHRLTPRQRLELFLPVCHAIQHAHQKGIIHRDLKPTNVLVADYDEQPIAKVIDFGVAKAIGEPLTQRTLFTALGQVVGTIEYMSPEQAKLNQLDVDTRSDVYSLGVLLYELLTGSTPHDRGRLREAAFDEMLRIVREEDPPKPSTRLNGSPTLDAVAARRRTDSVMLRRFVRGELDWIVMKAIEKDRNRRYETVNGLARDIERYLNNEAVHACPPSTAYRFGKVVRRNLAAFAIATILAVSVVLAAVGLAVSNQMIREERHHAEQARGLAEQRADEVRLGLERLKSANAWLERGRSYGAVRRWDDANSAFTNAVELCPEHAAAWLERGELMANLGLWDYAVADFGREMELREPDATMRWYRLALLRLSTGDDAGYRRLRDRMRERFAGTLDIFFATEVIRTCALSGDAEVDFTELVDLQRRILLSYPSGYKLYVMGTAQYRAGQYERAVQSLRESLAASPRLADPDLVYPVLAMAYFRQGQVVEAREALDKSAALSDRWTRARYEGQVNSSWVIHQGAVAAWPIAWWDWLEMHLFYREAKRMIDGEPAGDDPRWHVLRARSFAGLRRHAAADAEYGVALKLVPGDPQVQFESQRSAAYSAGARGDWPAAAAAFARTCALASNEVELWKYLAVAQLASGDAASHRATCATMIERFGNTNEPIVAANVLQACVLLPDGLSDVKPLLSLAEVADRAGHTGAWLRGAVLYRAGKLADAVRAFEGAARMYRPRAWEWAFLAMAHHRLGEENAARRCLANASQWIDDANTQTEHDLSGTLPTWGNWPEKVTHPLLVMEARMLLGAQ